MTSTVFPIMTPSLRAKLAIIGAALILLAISYGGSRLIHHATRDRLVIPDGRIAAATLLEQKLSGPQYFLRTAASTENAPSGQPGEVRITLAEAQAQIPRIVQARHFSGKQAAKIEQLVQRVVEPSPSRVVGDPTVDILRLNLALDALP